MADKEWIFPEEDGFIGTETGAIEGHGGLSKETVWIPIP